MRTAFDAKQGLIVIPVQVWGPKGHTNVRCALDTGATTTLLNVGVLVLLGYDPGLTAERVQVTTGSGVEFVPIVSLSKIRALGDERIAVNVVAHTLPVSAGVDGLLGLDFLRGQVLSIDFRKGLVELK